MKLIVTAGRLKSPLTLELLHWLYLNNYEVKRIICCLPLNTSRLKFILRNRLKKKALKIHRDQDQILKRNFGSIHDKKIGFFIWLLSRLKLSTNINSSSVVKEFQSANLVIYTGGGIVRGNALNGDCAPILNTHLGALPKIRGMNAAEWSLLLGEPMVSSVHVIKSGIDTGPVISTKQIKVQDVTNLSLLRAQALVSGLGHLKETIRRLHSVPLSEILLEGNERILSKQCYSLSTTMVDLLEDRLKNEYY